MNEFDVVIPVYRPDWKFDRLLRQLYCQSCLPETVLLMVTLTEPGLTEDEELGRMEERVLTAVRGTPGEGAVTLLLHGVKKQEFDHGGTRALGIRSLQRDYVLLMTQDAMPVDEHLTEQLLAGFSKAEQVSSVYARQVAGSKAPLSIQLTQQFNYPAADCIKSKETYEKLGIKNIFCSDVCCMYKREVFEALGGFETGLIFNEDMIYARKVIDAGYRIVYASGAQVEHWHAYTIRVQFQRNFDLAVSQAQFPAVFGDLSSTGEGIKMVTDVFGKLLRKGRLLDALHWIVVSGAKFSGYQLGKRYRHLPASLCRRFSMTPGYFR